MKIAVLSNQARSMETFWNVLIGRMISARAEVVCIAPEGDKAGIASLAKLGAVTRIYPLSRKGLNPFSDMRTFFALRKIFREEKPDFLFATTIKPVIYGCYAAWLAGVPAIFATITGLGYAFEQDSLSKKFVHFLTRHMYRVSLGHARAVFFQNRDDRELFFAEKILAPNARTFLARGTGVDTARFLPQAFPPLPLVFLMIARMLKAKGIDDYARAAKEVKSAHPEARFLLLGPEEQGPGAFSPEQLERHVEDGAIEYIGQTADVRPIIARSHVAVLPSWREGVPTAIMEAMSMGRPCIVTDVPGCRDAVTDGINGFVVPPRDPGALAKAMMRFINDPLLAQSMGAAGRKIAEEMFDATRVAAGILKDMGVGTGSE